MINLKFLSTQQMNCLNCGKPVEGNYCSHCGQPIKFKRFDLNYIGIRLLDAFDLERGFLHTIMALFKKPGQAIRDYVDGRRINFYNPFKLLFITGAISTLVFVFGSDPEKLSRPLQFLNLPAQDAFARYSEKYFSFFTVIVIPYFTFFSWIFFRNSKINYWENLMMNIYVAAGQFIIVILMAPAIIYYKSVYIITLYGLINYLYNVWAVDGFFKVNTLWGHTKAFLAVAIPQATAMFINYFLFIMAPSQVWSFLDYVFG